MIQQLRDLHPPATGPVPPLPPTVPLVEVDLDILITLINSKLQNGSAPGPSGWTGEMLAALIGDQECAQALRILVQDIFNGELDDNARSYLVASRLIPADKSDGGIRPIAVNEVFYKLAAMYGTEIVKEKFKTIFEPTQLGVGARGGSGRAVHLVQSGLETMGDQAILLKCDIKNAFNSRKREQILAELFKHEDLKAIWRLAHWAYKDVSSLLVFDQGDFQCSIESAQGVKQGDPLGAVLFSLSMNPLYAGCWDDDNVLKVAIMDDGNLVGRFLQVVAAFDRFANSLDGTGLEMRRNKCGILWPHSSPVPELLTAEAATRGIAIHLGAMPTLGAIVGFDAALISQWLNTKVQKQKPLFDLLQRAELPTSTASSICCAEHGLSDASHPPPLLAQHAQHFDGLVLETAIQRLGLPQPLSDKATLTLHMPIRIGGFGLRSAVRTSPAAYYSAVARTAPDILDTVPAEIHKPLLVEEKTRVQMANYIQSCLTEFKQAGIAAGDVLPADLEGFWAKHSQLADDSRLQKVLTGWVEDSALEEMKKTLTRSGLQRITSSAGKYAGAWLTTIPSVYALQLKTKPWQSRLGSDWASSFRTGSRPIAVAVQDLLI